MGFWSRIVAALDVRLTLIGFGGLYMLFAVGQASQRLATGSSSMAAIIPFLLIGLPGLILLYGGYKLPDTNIRQETYSHIVAWTFGGFSLLVGVVALRVLSPGTTIDAPLRSIVLATAIGSVAGFAIGLNEARAYSRAFVAEQHRQEVEETKAELEETVERLRKSNERLEQFAYAASHDLQEPLRMVSSYLQLLENRYADDLDEDAREYIDFAVDGADRMRGLVDSLLEYSQVSRDATFEPTDANAVLTDVLADLQLKIEETEATVTSDDLPTVTGDPDQLAQLFRNLISNALQYSGEQPPDVQVTADRRDGVWRFSVSDTGVGIDPQYQERIFNVFEQAHPDETARRRGVGLALCERIVERHGGDIWVESEPGEGSTFYFTIPVTTSQQNPSPSAVPAPAREDEENGAAE